MATPYNNSPKGPPDRHTFDPSPRRLRNPILEASKRALLIATSRSLNGAYNVGQLAKQGKPRSLIEDVCQRDFNAFGLANIRLGQAVLTVTDQRSRRANAERAVHYCH